MIPLFLDFDDTLFDTQAFKVWIRECLISHGATPQQIDGAYAPKPGTLYHPLRHIHAIWETPPAGIEKEVQSLYARGASLLFPDAITFLKDLDRSTYTPTILTLGDDEFQRAKIDGSGILNHLSDVLVCQEDKWKVLGNHVSPGTPLILVDDKPDTIVMVAKTHPKSYGVILDRSARERRRNYPLFRVVTNFDELRDLPLRFPELRRK
ncbi:MAG TPA: hypothetical protein VLA04_02635 [Verrucomicrobiae bacterium]|nr:hypothetical protein [Verrucomicrobiae bacterium]